MQYLNIDNRTIYITGGKSIEDYNPIRRKLLSDIKNPAIDIVYVIKNNTCYSDENIQLRWNMAPIDYAEPNSIIYRHAIGPCEVYAENTDSVIFSERVLLFRLDAGQELEVAVATGFSDAKTDFRYNNLSCSFIDRDGELVMHLDIHNHSASVLSWLKTELTEFIDA